VGKTKALVLGAAVYKVVVVVVRKVEKTKVRETGQEQVR